jgi:hypothetical protein
MKKLFLFLMLFASPSFSQTTKTLTVECYTIDVLAKELGKYSEMPLLIGNSLREEKNKPSQNTLILVANTETRTWTLLEKADDDKYCILGVGNHLSPVTKGKTL